VEGFIGFTAMGRRVHQRFDDLQKLADRSRPAMSEYDWQGALVLRLDVIRWPPALGMVLVTPVMTVLLTYVRLPALSKLFAPWLFSRTAAAASQSFEASKS
jgi:hypothetical protein